MGWQFSPYVFLYAIISVAMVIVGVVAARSHSTPGARSIAGLSGAIALWTACAGGVLARTDRAGQILFENVSFLAIALIPVFLLLFLEAHTNRKTPLTRYGPLPLFVIPALTQVAVWTNGRSGLMLTGRGHLAVDSAITVFAHAGPWYWVHAGYSYLLLAVSMYLLVRLFLVSDHLYRWQAGALLVGLVIPWIANASYVFGVFEIPIDPTPAALSATAVIFAMTVFRHKLLELAPVAREVARDELVDNLAEAVIILDERGTIVDANAPAETLLADSDAAVGRRLDAVLPTLASAIDLTADADVDADPDSKSDLAIEDGEAVSYYDVRVTELHRAAGFVAGYLVSLRDVTERRRREQRLDVLNRALRHDLRNEANVVLGYAELGLERHPDADWLRSIEDHVTDMIELGEKVRRIEQVLGGESNEPVPIDLGAVIDGVTERLTQDWPAVTVETDVPDDIVVEAIDLLDTALAHALENAIEHNDNPPEEIAVRVDVTDPADGRVEIAIADNGPGIHESERDVLLRGRETQLEHVSGLGLWIINWIVTESGGSVAFEANEPRGSVVRITLPAAAADPSTLDPPDYAAGRQPGGGGDPDDDPAGEPTVFEPGSAGSGSDADEHAE